MKRRTVGLIATAGIIIVGAVSVVGRGGGGVPVDTQPAARRAVFCSSVTASGQIVAQRYADIGSSVMGRLVDLRVKEGDGVKAGQILARIDAVQAAASAARFRPVTPGLIGGLDIGVSGANEGTAVVVGPFQALRELQDGQAVRSRASS
jgi:hypothetical protein